MDQQNGNSDHPPLTATQLKKECKRLEKLEKYKAKLQKQSKEVQNSEVKSKKKAKVKNVIEYSKNTPQGQKKDLSEFPDSYSPKYVEAAWYSWWEKEGYFKPEFFHGLQFAKPNDRFVIIIPPPNVTGSLHLGHALTCTIQDMLARWHRMNKKFVLWVPGCDHAGIATQVVVEKRLWRDCGKTRYDLGRELFIEKIWEWKNEKGNRIYDQLKCLGSSCDWDRAVYTMDPMHSRAVNEAFVRLHESGQIYRDQKIVNWSPTLKSVISNIEVEKMALSGRTLLNVPGYSRKIEFGVLVHFAYPVVDGGEIVVATTRVETMLGDVAIAVHPDDVRYKKFHGKFAMHPFTERLLEIVCDEDVDIEFGTGAVKISPAHDAHDYDLAMAQHLPIVNCFDDSACIAEGFGEFSGLKRFDARVAVIDALRSRGLFRDITEIETVLPICSRSKDVIEPLLKSQWFLKVSEDAKRSLKLIENDRIKVIPDCYKADCRRWLSNIHDWCISRQLWWGHRIPAYLVTSKSSVLNCDLWISGNSEQEVREKAATKYNLCPDDIQITQDSDVLDTWFSSSLFPFSVFGWPENTEDLKRFYPGNLLETGNDILFFWVLRMIIMSLKLNNEIPFENVFLHAIIRDAHGRKMSKSLGNIIDPLDVINGITLEQLHEQLQTYNLDEKEVQRAKKGQKADFPHGIPECGTDALRFALAAYTSQAKDINLDISRVQGYRHFCNKIWNAFRFASVYAFANETIDLELLKHVDSPVDKWILSKLCGTAIDCDSGFKSYDFALVCAALYNFWLYDFCDIYIEYAKTVLYGNKKYAPLVRAVLLFCLNNALRLLHPIMPFITEELFQRLPESSGLKREASICISSYPNPKEFEQFVDSNLESKMAFIRQCITKIRSVRADYLLTGKSKIDVYLSPADLETSEILSSFIELITHFTAANKVKILKADEPRPLGCVTITVSNKCDIYVFMEDIDIVREKGRLREKIADLEGQVKKLKDVMSQCNYEKSVPIDVQSSNTEKVSILNNEICRLQDALKQFSLIENKQ